MTDKELFSKLLNIYIRVLESIKEDKNIGRINQICKETYTDYGVCYLSRQMVGVYLEKNKLIINKDNYEPNRSMYWTNPPHVLYRISDIIESFEYRIEKLSAIVKSLE